MKTPFKMKYDTSPLKSILNSPLKQGEGFGHLQDGAARAQYTSDWNFLKSSKQTVPAKTTYTVECEAGQSCPAHKIDENANVPGHQVGDYKNYLEIDNLHKEMKDAKSSSGGHSLPKNRKILSESKVTFETMYDLKNRINSNRAITMKFNPKQHGTYESFDDLYKRTGTWEGQGSLPAHLEGTYKKPNLLQRIFHKSNFKWRSGGTT